MKVPCRICDGTGEVEVRDPIDTPPRIVADKGVCGGAPRIDGTRITVSVIKALEFRGLRPEDIRYLYPELTLEHIAAALEHVEAALPCWICNRPNERAEGHDDPGEAEACPACEMEWSTHLDELRGQG